MRVSFKIMLIYIRPLQIRLSWLGKTDWQKFYILDKFGRISIFFAYNYLFPLGFFPIHNVTSKWEDCFKYYLKHEKECFIIFKTRGAAERFRYDKREFECFE
jgi:hypothetical protein